MHATGYLQQKKHYPFGLGVAVAIHAAGLSALWLAKNDYIPPIKTILTIRNIPLPRPQPTPEPVPPPPAPSETVRLSDPPPLPIERIVRARPDTVRIVPLPPAKPIDSFGAGAGIAVTPPPLPVLTGPEIDPRYAGDFQPPYPAGKQRLGEEGLVVVRVLIGADGRVKRVEPANGADEAFVAATERHALRRWRFKPATRDGVPIESWRTMRVRFEMLG